MLDGGAGNDVLFANAGDDTVSGGTGNDNVSGGDGIDTLDGGDGDDTLSGDAGSDELTGDAGNDTLSGGAGNDYADGGADDDTLTGGNDNDTLVGGAGNDTIQGNAGDDILSGDAGDDTLDGGDGDDDLEGGDGTNSLDSGSGTNTANQSGTYLPALVRWGFVDGDRFEGESARLSIRRMPAPWGQGTVTATVELYGGSAHPHNPQLDDATAGSDFGGPMTLTITIPADRAPAEDGCTYSDEITIPLLTDLNAEGDETFWAKIVIAQGGYVIPDEAWGELYIVNSSLTAHADYVSVVTDDEVPLHILDNDDDSAGSEKYIDDYTDPQYGTVTPVVNPETGLITDLLYQRDPAHATEVQNIQYRVKDQLGNQDSSQVFVSEVREEYTLNWSISGTADEGDPELPPAQRTPIGATLSVSIDRPAPAGGITVNYYTLNPNQIGWFDPLRPLDEIAAPGDLQNPSGSITIPAGETEAEVTLTPLDDTTVEKNKWAYIALNHDSTDPTIVAQTSQYVVRDSFDVDYQSFEILDNEWRWITPNAPTMSLLFKQAVTWIPYQLIAGWLNSGGKADVLPYGVRAESWAVADYYNPLPGQYTAATGLQPLTFNLDPLTGNITLTAKPTVNANAPNVSAALEFQFDIFDDSGSEHTVPIEINFRVGVGGVYDARYYQLVGEDAERGWGLADWNDKMPAVNYKVEAPSTSFIFILRASGRPE